MIRVCAPEVSRSMADWARSASLIIDIHSDGSRLVVTMVAAWFSLLPRHDGAWLAAPSRHWNVDRGDPR